MLENDDSDIDLNLLSELLDKAESDDKDDQTLKTPSTQVDSKQVNSFGSILEDLDRIPVKKCSRNQLADKTSLFNNQEPSVKGNKSSVHTGDTDSSEDEEARKYGNADDGFGSSVKRMLKTTEEEKRSNPFCLSDRKSSNARISKWKSSPSSSASSTSLCLPAKKDSGNNVTLLDPSIGIRVINPLVSSTVIKERLVGRRVVSMAQVKQFVSEGKVNDDWVIFGVVVSKAPPRTSAKGTHYSIIKLSDLRGPGNPKLISLFLFSNAYKKHGKDSVGTVFGVLNPGIMDNNRNHNDEACLSVDNSDRIMVLGTSKDFGLCKSKKKNGDNCTAVVNMAQCEYCVYHVKQEYQKCSRRSDIQSSFNGVGLTNLRNKVLGKSEVFYGGQSFSAVPAKKSKKLLERDQSRLMALSGNSKTKQSLGLKPYLSKSKKDSDRLSKLQLDDHKSLSKPSSKSLVTAQFNPDEIKPDDAKNAALAVIAEKKKTLEARKESCEETKPIEELKTYSDHLNSCNSATAEESVLSDTLKDAQVVNDMAPFSRGVKVTLSLNDKKTNASGMMPSSLGLGQSADTKTQAVTKKETCVSANKSPMPCKANKSGSSSDGKSKISSNPKASKEPECPSLSSDQLKKLASNGMDLESRMLKQAAQKAALQEQASKLNKNATPSMLGLGRNPANRAKVESTGCLRVFPKLGTGLSPSSIIDLNAPISKKISNTAKMNAINIVKNKGGISKGNPNFRDFESRKKEVKETKISSSKKRPREETPRFLSGEIDSPLEDHEKDKEAKKARFKQLMEATSRHVDLIEAAENEAQEEYFGKLEKKEQMEEKMLNTFKVACKAVRCLTCKYTSFSASELCKTQRHPLKVMDAMKRFFKCGDCGHRTVSLEIIPLVSCPNCSSSRWEKAAMIAERKVGITQETLSVRGMEETFIGSVTTGANINLLVPDEGT